MGWDGGDHATGFVAGCGDGLCIGLPVVGQFGPEWMQDTVLPSVLSGRKRICLAITEPEVRCWDRLRINYLSQPYSCFQCGGNLYCCSLYYILACRATVKCTRVDESQPQS